jgi:hypothetical protein
MPSLAASRKIRSIADQTVLISGSGSGAHGPALGGVAQAGEAHSFHGYFGFTG